MSLWSDLGLDMARHRLIALVGAGGKTTALYALAREAAQAGQRVAVTTTTHILPHPRLPLAQDPGALAQLLTSHPAVVLGKWDKPGKLTAALPPHKLRGLADTVLVEADGARGLPLKAPADHEPVLPPDADAVVAVAGLDALGQPVAQVCHRPEQVCALLGVGPEHPVAPADIVDILSSPQGGRKNVPAEAAFRCLLNKADTPALRGTGEEIQTLLAARGVPAALHTYGEEERDGQCWF